VIRGFELDSMVMQGVHRMSGGGCFEALGVLIIAICKFITFSCIGSLTL
jgi:hypothetical protein